MLLSGQSWFNDDDVEILIDETHSKSLSLIIQSKQDATNRYHIVLSEAMAHKLFWKLNHALLHGEQYPGDYE